MVPENQRHDLPLVPPSGRRLHRETCVNSDRLLEIRTRKKVKLFWEHSGENPNIDFGHPIFSGRPLIEAQFDSTKDSSRNQITMKTNKTSHQIMRATAIIALASASLAQAAIITVDFDKTDFTASAGTVAKTSDDTAGTGGSPADVTYTVSGLTLDGVGTADDAFTFTVTLSGTGATAVSGSILGFGFDGATALSREWGVNSGDPDNFTDKGRLLDHAGESMTISLVSSSLTLGGGETGWEIASQGLTGFYAGQDVASTFDLAGTSADATGISGDADITFSAVSSFTATYNTAANGDEGIGIGGIDATFDIQAVPEPSSAALLGLGGFALILRRRRN